jgi:hypothetical protein
MTTEDIMRFIPVFQVPVPKLNPPITSPAGLCSNYTPHTCVREAADISGSFHEALRPIPAGVLGTRLYAKNVSSSLWARNS